MTRILVVEDELEIGMALSLLLESEGYTAVLAENGAVALQRLEREPLPSLILLDLRMPVMNGWQFLDAIRPNPIWSKIPVLISTAESGPIADHLPVLHKPFEVEDLFASVRRLCGRPQQLAAVG